MLDTEALRGVDLDIAQGSIFALLGYFSLDDDLVTLLDEVFINAVPVARRLLRLLEARGWTGWTKLERIRAPS